MKMRSVFSLIFGMAVCLLLVTATQIHGQAVGAGRASNNNNGSYTITGKVILPSGKPAVGVRVSLRSEYTNPWTTTDIDGNYRFGGVPAGNYTVTVTVEGLAPQNEFRTIYQDTPAGQAVHIPIFLRDPSPKKGEVYSDNPLLKDVPSAALAKFKSGMEKLDKNDAKGSLPLLDQAIAAYPNFAAAYYEKGSAFLKLNDLDKSIEAFVKAISIKSDYLEAKYGYGLAMFEKKNYEVAEAVFRDVLKARADMADARMNLGICLFYLKNVDAAVAELKNAAAAKGGEKLALAHLYLGQIYVQKKQNADAIAELQTYVEMVPKAPNAERIKRIIEDLKKQS